MSVLRVSQPPARQLGPEAVGWERAAVAGVELLVLAGAFEDGPFREVACQHGCTVLADTEPGVVGAREGEGFAFVGLDCCVDCQGLQGVDLGAADGADDPGGADDVPGCFWVGVAEGEEGVFLGVVEVWFEGVTGVLGTMLVAATKEKRGVGICRLALQIPRMVSSLGLGVPEGCQSLKVRSVRCSLTL